jgi:large subunit ribosomal protein L15
MQLHEIKPQHKKKSRVRVGRGGKRGTFSGRGVKGQKSRAGRKMQPAMREAIKRFHKLKGYRQILKPKQTLVVTLRTLEKIFPTGSIITPAILANKKAVRKINGKVPAVKIVAGGQLTKKFTVNGCSLSQKAREAIEKVGGSIK